MRCRLILQGCQARIKTWDKLNQESQTWLGPVSWPHDKGGQTSIFEEPSAPLSPGNRLIVLPFLCPRVKRISVAQDPQSFLCAQTLSFPDFGSSHSTPGVYCECGQSQDRRQSYIQCKPKSSFILYPAKAAVGPVPRCLVQVILPDGFAPTRVELVGDPPFNAPPLCPLAISTSPRPDYQAVKSPTSASPNVLVLVILPTPSLTSPSAEPMPGVFMISGKYSRKNPSR